MRANIRSEILFMAYPKKNTGPTFQSISEDIKAGKWAPVYYLMGAEPYYIDRLCEQIIASVIPNEEERDFNLIVLYGPDTTTDQIVSAAKGFPMMGEHLLIVVKEAQALRDIDKLEYYLRQPAEQNVVVFCHKNGTIDRRKKVATMVSKQGVLFESPKVGDREVLSFVSDYARQKGVDFEPRAVQMMAEYIGADLMRISSEIDKLTISLPEGQRTITSDQVSEQIGISKQYNVFELQDAIATKNIQKANEIVNYFDKNQKETPIQMILPSLYTFFANVMQAYYAPDRSDRGIGEWLGMSEWQVRRGIGPAMRNYTGVKCMYILNAIRKTDAKSKGVENPDTGPGELMKELLYFILH